MTTKLGSVLASGKSINTQTAKSSPTSSFSWDDAASDKVDNIEEEAVGKNDETVNQQRPNQDKHFPEKNHEFNSPGN